MRTNSQLSDREYISPGEASAILGVSPKTIARMAADGKIHAIRPGGHRRYRRSDVEELAS